MRHSYFVSFSFLLSLLRAEDGAVRRGLFGSNTVREIQAAETRQTNSAAPRKQLGPESIIKNIVLAWNRGDVRAIAAFFLTDGVLVTTTGSVIQSRGEIQKTIAKERQGTLKDTLLKNSVDDVSVDGGYSDCQGKYQLDGMTSESSL
jgi:hypothetical protein